jgi:hypothetical protein
MILRIGILYNGKLSTCTNCDIHTLNQCDSFSWITSYLRALWSENNCMRLKNRYDHAHNNYKETFGYSRPRTGGIKSNFQGQSNEIFLFRFFIKRLFFSWKKNLEAFLNCVQNLWSYSNSNFEKKDYRHRWQRQGHPLNTVHDLVFLSVICKEIIDSAL